MPWPDPVIGILSKIPDRRWRCAYQSHIPVGLRYEQIILISLEEAAHKCILVRFLLNVFSKFINILINDGLPFILRQCGRYTVQHLFAYIFYTHDKCYIQSGVGKFLAIILSPEAIPDIVMIKRRMILNGIKATMMIRYYETFGRYHFTGAKPAEVYNSVFQRSFVNIIYVLCADLHPQALHFFFIHSFQQ